MRGLFYFFSPTKQGRLSLSEAKSGTFDVLQALLTQYLPNNFGVISQKIIQRFSQNLPTILIRRCKKRCRGVRMWEGFISIV